MRGRRRRGTKIWESQEKAKESCKRPSAAERQIRPAEDCSSGLKAAAASEKEREAEETAREEEKAALAVYIKYSASSPSVAAARAEAVATCQAQATARRSSQLRSSAVRLSAVAALARSSASSPVLCYRPLRTHFCSLFTRPVTMDRAHRMNVRAAAAALSLFASAYAQTVSPPGQPSTTDAPLGQFKIVGDSIASAQQVCGRPPCGVRLACG